MKIGIVGAGRMGERLASLWGAAGHRVMLSFSRDEAKLREVARRVGAEVGSAREAARFGGVDVLTVPWAAREAALSGAGDLNGKALLTSVMPLGEELSSLLVFHTDSSAEEVARLAPGEKVVESFNSVFAPPLYEEMRERPPARGSPSFSATTTVQRGSLRV